MNVDDDYQHRKEAFVSNLNGTTLFETGSVMVTICSTYFLCQVTKNFFEINEKSLRNFLVEFFLLVVPMLLVTTIFASISHVFHLIIWFVGLSIYFRLSKRKNSIETHSTTSFSRLIENFRGQIFLVTCLCILAVDFPIFPRRYAKTENFGFSGMDLGVGLFAIAHGTVSSQARGKSTNFKEFFIENFLLLLLGTIRFVSLKFFSYVEHVSEYGVHWNFFLTLCWMKIIGNFLFFDSISSFFVVLILHEIVSLKYFNVENYLISSIQRKTFVDANREGICSLPGYVCLYLLGIFIGKKLIEFERKEKFSSIFFVLSPILLGLAFFNGNASRKLCNAVYICSTAGLAALCFCGFAFIQILFIRKGLTTESILLKNVNQKGLDVFLFANVLTGVVNLNIRTIDTSTFVSFLILFVYSFIVSTFAYFFPSIIKFLMKNFKLTK